MAGYNSTSYVIHNNTISHVNDSGVVGTEWLTVWVCMYLYSTF